MNCVTASRATHYRSLFPHRANPIMSVQFNQQLSSGDHVNGMPYSSPSASPMLLGSTSAEDSEGVPWARYIDALKRHVLVIIAIVAAGSVVGMFAARRVHPVYDVQSTVWIAPGASSQTGPIRPAQLLPATSWVELLRSYAIIDPASKAKTVKRPSRSCG